MINIPYGVRLDTPSRGPEPDGDKERCRSCDCLLDHDEVEEGEEYCASCLDIDEERLEANY